MTQFPTLGAGLGYRQPFLAELFLHRAEVDFLEIVADHYIDAVPRQREELALLQAHFPLVPHGLSLSLGSAEGLDALYLSRLARLIEQVNPPWWSEHIAFTRAGGVDIGHLTPLPFTREAVDTLCRNIATASQVISTPLILENITYTLTLPGAEMTEVQFLTEVVERTGCGLLLDVTNLYTNAVNFGFDIDAFLDGLPWERVVQLHYVGGEWHDGQLVDSHSHPTPSAVWDLLTEVMRRAPVCGTILERDESLPALADLLPEVARAREIGRRYGR